MNSLLKSAKILTVDDSPGNLQVLANMLWEQQCEVIIAQGGRQAIEAVDALPPDLILLDITMPDMDGFETCRRLKSMPSAQDIPIIFLTGKTESENLVEGFRLGAVDYVTKPFKSLELLSRLRTHLELKFKKEELQNTLDHLRASQKQLIVQEKLVALGELTRGVAHEIRNPLTFVLSHAEECMLLGTSFQEMLESKKGLKDTQKITEMLELAQHSIASINSNSKRMNNVIEAMYLHSNVNTGTVNEVTINDSIRKHSEWAFHSMKAKVKDFNVEFEFDLDTSVQPIQGVPQDIGRVFFNIFTNAFFSLREKGQKQGTLNNPLIKLSSKDLGNAVQVSIWDNGLGIAPENIEKLYLPFFTTKPLGTGIGLGLFLSYEIIVNGHQGNFDVKSQEGEFSEFIIELPYSKDEHFKE